MRTLVLMNIKMLTRHTKVYWLLSVAAVYLALLLSVRGKYVQPPNILLGAAVFTYLIVGFLFVNPFLEGKRERMFYFMFPSDLREIILAKNLSLLITVFALFGFAALATALLYQVRWQQVSDAITYLFATICPFLVFGNYLSVRLPMSESSAEVMIATVLQAIVIFIVSIPYLVLRVLFDNPSLCLVFSLLSVILWYFLAIPHASALMQKHKFAMIGEMK